MEADRATAENSQQRGQSNAPLQRGWFSKSELKGR